MTTPITKRPKSRWTVRQTFPWIEHGRDDPADNDNNGMIEQCVACKWLGYERNSGGQHSANQYCCPRCEGPIVTLLLTEAQKRLLSPELP